LLTVVAIIAIVLGITVPMIFTVRRAGGANNAVNTIGSAISTAQAWARGNRQTFTYTSANATIEPYQGMALGFFNSTTIPGLTVIRLLQHTDPTAMSHPGYTDLSQWEPMTLPGGSAVVGISSGTSTGMVLVPPPFAVCFDPSGNLTFNAAPTIYADTSTNSAGTYAQIPTVLGVVAYSPNPGSQLLQFGQIIWFSRFSGMMNKVQR
jgi:hypothetical protein